MNRFLLDVNVLVYAHRRDLKEHAASRRWLDGALQQGHEILLASETVFGYLRVTTNPFIFKPATVLVEALDHIEKLMAAPQVQVIHFSEKSLATFRSLADAHDIAAGGVADAYLAALALEHDAALVSTDKGFQRFRQLRLINPFASA